MEIILKTDNVASAAKVIALAKELNIIVEQREESRNHDRQEILKRRILGFNADVSTSFGDASEWEKGVRADRELPFLE